MIGFAQNQWQHRRSKPVAHHSTIFAQLLKLVLSNDE